MLSQNIIEEYVKFDINKEAKQILEKCFEECTSSEKGEYLIQINSNFNSFENYFSNRKYFLNHYTLQEKFQWKYAIFLIDKLLICLHEYEIYIQKNLFESAYIRLYVKNIFSDIFDMITWIKEIIKVWSFISTYIVLRSLKERLLYIAIVFEEDTEYRAKIYLDYYKKFLNDFVTDNSDFHENINYKKFWFQHIPKFKNSWINKLMKKFNIEGYHYNSLAVHWNYGFFTHSPFWVIDDLILKWDEPKKIIERYKLLHNEDFFVVILELITIWSDIVYYIDSWFDNNEKCFQKYLNFLHYISELYFNEFTKDKTNLFSLGKRST